MSAPSEPSTRPTEAELELRSRPHRRPTPPGGHGEREHGTSVTEQILEFFESRHETRHREPIEGRFSVSAPEISTIFAIGAADAATIGSWKGTFRGVTLGTVEDVWIGSSATRIVAGFIPAKGEVGVADLEKAAIRGEETLAWVETAIAGHALLDTFLHAALDVPTALRLTQATFKLTRAADRGSHMAGERSEADERAAREKESTHADASGAGHSGGTGGEGHAKEERSTADAAGAGAGEGAHHEPAEPSFEELLEERTQPSGTLHLHAEEEVLVTSTGSVASSAIVDNVMFGGLLAEVVGGVSAGIKGGVSAELQAIGTAEVSSNVKSSVESMWDVEIAAHRGLVEVLGPSIEIGSRHPGHGIPKLRAGATREVAIEAVDAVSIEAGSAASGPTLELDGEHEAARLRVGDSFVSVGGAVYVHGEHELRLSAGGGPKPRGTFSPTGLVTSLAASRAALDAGIESARTSWNARFAEGTGVVAGALGALVPALMDGAPGARVGRVLTGVLAGLTAGQAVASAVRRTAIAAARETYAKAVAHEVEEQAAVLRPRIRITSDAIELRAGRARLRLASDGVLLKLDTTEIRMDGKNVVIAVGDETKLTLDGTDLHAEASKTRLVGAAIDLDATKRVWLRGGGFEDTISARGWRAG